MPTMIRVYAFFLAALMLVPATASTTEELLRMTEQLDRMDKLDFRAAIEKADKCTRARDFNCSESQLKSARKLTADNASKNALRQAEVNLAAEKETVESERRAYAQHQRELREAEERLREDEERSQRQARAAQDEDSGMSTGQALALFGSLIQQSAASQSALRMAQQQANNRRFEAQQTSVQANIAADQRRFAEERARIEARRSDIQQQQRQLVAQGEVRQNQQAQALQQREQQAAAERIQLAQRQETESRARAAAQVEQQSRASAQTLSAAASSRTPTSNASSSGSDGVAGKDSRIKLYGTMYVVHYAALKHSRSDKNNVTLIGRITPVQWTYDVPRVSPLQQPSGRSEAVPYQVSDLLIKQMRPVFFDYLREKYTICNEDGPKPDGCHGWSVYHQIGNSAAEVQGKLDVSLRSFSTPATNGNGLNYPPSIAYSE